MKKTGSELAVFALEQIGITHTFGIPGVHNIELYDELNKSQQITPILVTHENAATFMADAFSRVSGKIGVAMIVPAAGLTNGMSGIGEAYLDGIPSLIISGGVRRDSGRSFQLHQLDQGKILDGIIKKYYLVERHEDVISTIYAAYETALAGEPGPVFVEIPAEIQLFKGEVAALEAYRPRQKPGLVSVENIEQAAQLLVAAGRPALYLGWGAVHATLETTELAEILQMPVATTMQGLSAFSAKHPLHVGVGFGPSSPPAAQKAFQDCDCLLAVGCRFSELATGSYGFTVPENLIHIDINPTVFHKNYPAKITIEGDSRDCLQALIKKIKELKSQQMPPKTALVGMIRTEKEKYFQEWLPTLNKSKVSPGHFFKALRAQLADDAFIVVDDGTHTFLTAELFPVYAPRHFISPTDFNCMGYSVPAAIATKFAFPEKQVVAVVGDGSFLMTGLELITASTYNLGVVFFVFHDGELGQISQFQKVPLNRKTCTVLGNVNFEGMAMATQSRYLPLNHDAEIETTITKALNLSQNGVPVLVDVNIDYSKKTMLTKGVLKTNLSRFPLKEKLRFITRAVKRHVVG